MKINKKLLVITTLIIILPMVIGIILWDQLPAEIAVHWGADNQPDRWSSKAFAVFGLPAIMAALHVLSLLITFADPKKNNFNKKAVGILYWLIPAVSIFATGSTYANALGIEVNMLIVSSLLVGIMLIVLGNYLPKSKQNYTFGYKIPWTLNSEENWNRTHRLAGWIMVACGFAFIINVFILSGIVILFVLAASLVPIIYSYILYKKGI